jgi:hypothetical protein
VVERPVLEHHHDNRVDRGVRRLPVEQSVGAELLLRRAIALVAAARGQEGGEGQRAGPDRAGSQEVTPVDGGTVRAGGTFPPARSSTFRAGDWPDMGELCR